MNNDSLFGFDLLCYESMFLPESSLKVGVALG